MRDIFYFGEQVKGYDIRVFNEREIRAGAGILFALGMVAFFNALLIGNFNYIKVFVVIFFLDFFIRIFINPKFSPSLVLGRIGTKNQVPEYAGAPQKKFAWAIGFVLSLIMFFLLVVFDIRSYLNLIICLLCLLFMFFESAFGICIGCFMYNKFTKNKAELCPGGACSIKRKEKIQEISFYQIGILLVFVFISIFLVYLFF